MHKNPQATANAFAVVGGALYLICTLWTLLSRSSFIALMNTWTHGVDLASLPSKPLDLGTILTGLITFVLSAWVTGYAFAYTYNYFAGKK